MTARDFFHRPDGGLRAPWRLAGYIIVFGVTTVALSTLARRLLQASPTLRAHIGNETAGFWVLLASVWLAHLVMLRAVDRRPWSTVGLARSQCTTRRLVIGLLLGGLCIGIPSLGLLSMHWLRAEPVPGTPERWLRYALALVAFFLPQSLAEEMLVRGYPFTVLRESVGWPAALVATSVVFGGLHAANPGADVQSVLLVTLAGLFLGGVLLLTESLYAAWMAHFAWNWTMAALLHTAVSGIVSAPPDYRVVDSGPDWATGGVWGPEGGAGAAIGMLVGLWIFISWRRRRAAGAHEPQPRTAWLNALR